MNLQSPETLKKFFSSVNTFSDKTVEEFAAFLLKNFQFIEDPIGVDVHVPASLVPEIADAQAQKYFKQILDRTSAKDRDKDVVGSDHAVPATGEIMEIENELLESLDKLFPSKSKKRAVVKKLAVVRKSPSKTTSKKK